MWILISLVVVFVLALYYILKTTYGFWTRRGVPCVSAWRTYKNIYELLTLKKSIGQVYTEIYNEYPHLSYVGVYKLHRPAMLIRDPELLESIFIKDFSSFRDNDLFVDENVDPIFGRTPFVLKGEKWRYIKTLLLPCFSGKKLRSMYPLIEGVANNMVRYLENSPGSEGDEGIETKDLAVKFTTDASANCVFGLDGKSFEGANAEIREVGKRLREPKPFLAFTHLCVMVLPSLASMLNTKFFPDDVASYFRHIVSHMTKYRQENRIERGDFLDLLNEHNQKLGEEGFSQEDIVAHCVGFFVDGFEITHFPIFYGLYELAANPECQAKLREEIEAAIAETDGKLTYDSVRKIDYLEYVMLETLRKYPPLPFLTKTCTKQFTFPSPLGKGKGPDLTIEPGTSILLSPYGVHWDPKYYPNPEKFDPERFSPENQKNSTKCTFMSFGIGPRICLGLKFGVVEVKVALATIILNFDVCINKRTVVPPVTDPRYFLMKPKGGLWLNYYKRT